MTKPNFGELRRNLDFGRSTQTSKPNINLPIHSIASGTLPSEANSLPRSYDDGNDHFTSAIDTYNTIWPSISKPTSSLRRPGTAS
jgi:hypothetical protein